MHKQYLTQFITREIYSKWLDGKKVIIQSPTGTGKNHLALNEFAAYCRIMGKKVAVLCNRKLLREQYEFDLAELFPRYIDMVENIDVLTYQQLAEALKKGASIQSIIDDYDVIIYDEVHFFYADADFNGLGTYVLLQALIKAAFYKTNIFMTATLKETLPLLENTLSKFQMKLEREDPHLNIDKYKYRGDINNFQFLADFSRFSCHYCLDMETLVDEIANSEKKSVIFIDDNSIAKQFKAKLLKKKNISDDDISMLSAQIIDENPNDLTIRQISAGNVLPRKILITTSVLDNGVSIHDPEVGNVVIATESRVSFIQMLGRVRGENVEECRLFIFPRDRAYYEKRVQQYSEKMVWFDKLSKIPLQNRREEILYAGWYGSDDAAIFLRNAVVVTKNEFQFYDEPFTACRIVYPNPILSINYFAKEKIGNMLQAERKFLRLACQSDKAAVAREQIKWIKKKPEELVVWESTYRKEREKMLVEKLLTIRDFSQKDMQKVKEEIACEFRKDILEDISLQDKSFSTDKMIKICSRYNLRYEKGIDSDGKTTYTVKAHECLNEQGA